jgi:hypothetical protein
MAQSDGNLNLTDGRTVRPYGTKKKIQTNTDKQNTENLGCTSEGIRWHNLMEISMYGRTDSVRPYRTKKKCYGQDKQTQKTGIVHLKGIISIRIISINLLNVWYCHFWIAFELLCDKRNLKTGYEYIVYVFNTVCVEWSVIRLRDIQFSCGTRIKYVM